MQTPLSLSSATRTAFLASVRRTTLTTLLNGKELVLPEMALRIEKALDIIMDMVPRLQAWYGAA